MHTYMINILQNKYKFKKYMYIITEYLIIHVLFIEKWT